MTTKTHFYSVRFEMDILKFSVINHNGYVWKTKFDSVADACRAKEKRLHRNSNSIELGGVNQ